MTSYGSIHAAMNILSNAKVAAMYEVMDRTERNSKRTVSEERESVYEAMEAWRTASNAWDYLLKSI